MDKALKILGIVFLVSVIPLIDILVIPVMLGLMLIPGVAVPIFGAFMIVAFVHYLVIKLIVDTCKPDSTEKK